jgi:hypothetical protein
MDSRRITGRSIEEIVDDLSRTLDPAVQTSLKQELQLHPQKLEAATYAALRNNPFIELSPSELSDFETRRQFRNADRDLILMRQLAAKLGGRRIAVFAMPKSGSSFVRSAIMEATGLPGVGLTSIAADGGFAASLFGMNGREQELDELALIVQTLRSQGSWVAQHHTRFTPYLAGQLRFYRITPILTVRNIFDAIVSMDDMIMQGRATRQWWKDPPHALPLDFPELDQAERLTLLGEDFGIWLIKFLVSWKRAIADQLAYPLILSYEADILDPPGLGARLADFMGLDAGERGALARYVEQAPDEKARFNKGVAGRGSAVPREARERLERYARRFRVDLGDDGMRYLFGEAS